MPRIAVIGPGAVGATVAAWLAQEPVFEVIVCARTPFDGLEIEHPAGLIRALPTLLTDPAVARPVDWVLIATKAYDAAAAAAWLPALLAPHTRVAVLQNGVEHVARFAPYVAAKRITPVVVDIPAERRAPGRVLQRRHGTLVSPAGSDGDSFAALFAATPVQASTTADFPTQAWRKLCVNCAGAVSALTLQPAGVARREPVAALMRTLVREAVEVGRTQGAVLGDDLPDAVVEGYRNGPADAINSMHADRLAGRRMEVDARNGVIVRLARAAGLEAPANAMVVALLEAAEGSGPAA